MATNQSKVRPSPLSVFLGKPKDCISNAAKDSSIHILSSSLTLQFRHSDNIVLVLSYSPLWVFSFTRSCQASLSVVTFVQFFTPNTPISFRASSHHVFLGRRLRLFSHWTPFKNPPYHSILLHPKYMALPFQSLIFYDLIMLFPPINLFNS